MALSPGPWQRLPEAAGATIRQTRPDQVSQQPSLTVALSDSFEDPSDGILPLASTNPAFGHGYVGGEYRIAKAQASATTVFPVYVPSTFSDVVIDVDARIVGDPKEVIVQLHSRGSGPRNYFLSVAPFAGNASVARWDDGVVFPLW